MRFAFIYILFASSLLAITTQNEALKFEITDSPLGKISLKNGEETISVSFDDASRLGKLSVRIGRNEYHLNEYNTDTLSEVFTQEGNSLLWRWQKDGIMFIMRYTAKEIENKYGLETVVEVSNVDAKRTTVDLRMLYSFDMPFAYSPSKGLLTGDIEITERDEIKSCHFFKGASYKAYLVADIYGGYSSAAESVILSHIDNIAEEFDYKTDRKSERNVNALSYYYSTRLKETEVFTFTNIIFSFPCEIASNSKANILFAGEKKPSKESYLTLVAESTGGFLDSLKAEISTPKGVNISAGKNETAEFSSMAVGIPKVYTWPLYIGGAEVTNTNYMLKISTGNDVETENIFITKDVFLPFTEEKGEKEKNEKLFNPLGKAVAAVFPDPDIRVQTLIENGVDLILMTNLMEAITGDRFRAIIVDASTENLSTMVSNYKEIRAYTERGGWFMLWGVTPHSLELFNKIVGINHIIRPFRRERVVLADKPDEFTEGLSVLDVYLFSGKPLPNEETRYPAADTFSYIVDIDDVAPFAEFPPLEYWYKASSPTEPSPQWPLNMVNGLTGVDHWAYSFDILYGNGVPKKWSLKLPREEQIENISVSVSDIYNKIKKINVFLDSDTTPIPMVFNADGRMAIIPVSNRKATNITFDIADWQANPSQDVFSVDLITITAHRTQHFRSNMKPLLNIGGLVRYDRGKGGFLLNQFALAGASEREENVTKKVQTISVILENMEYYGYEKSSVVVDYSKLPPPIVEGEEIETVEKEIVSDTEEDEVETLKTDEEEANEESTEDIEKVEIRNNKIMAIETSRKSTRLSIEIKEGNTYTPADDENTLTLEDEEKKPLISIGNGEEEIPIGSFSLATDGEKEFNEENGFFTKEWTLNGFEVTTKQGISSSDMSLYKSSFRSVVGVKNTSASMGATSVNLYFPLKGTNWYYSKASSILYNYDTQIPATYFVAIPIKKSGTDKCEYSLINSDNIGNKKSYTEQSPQDTAVITYTKELLQNDVMVITNDFEIAQGDYYYHETRAISVFLHAPHTSKDTSQVLFSMLNGDEEFSLSNINLKILIEDPLLLEEKEPASKNISLLKSGEVLWQEWKVIAKEEAREKPVKIEYTFFKNGKEEKGSLEIAVSIIKEKVAEEIIEQKEDEEEPKQKRKPIVIDLMPEESVKEIFTSLDNINKSLEDIEKGISNFLKEANLNTTSSTTKEEANLNNKQNKENQ